jgi:hypothetical protein
MPLKPGHWYVGPLVAGDDPGVLRGIGGRGEPRTDAVAVALGDPGAASRVISMKALVMTIAQSIIATETIATLVTRFLR